MTSLIGGTDIQRRIQTRPEATNTRKAAVDSYLQAQVSGASEFVCSHLDACRSSHDGAFLEGQLHHIGGHYDAYIDERPFRVVIVGQEYGHPPAMVSLDSREEMIMRSGLEHRFVAQDGLPGRNPHMKGTTSLLRLLYGRPPGDDYEGEWVTTTDGVRIHLFEAFALVNYLICSATPEGSSRGQSTRLMKTNCARHFRSVLELLQPTVLVCQGKGFSSWVVKALGVGRVEAQDRVFHFELGGVRGVGAILNHPSTPNWVHSWGSLRAPYLREMVLPTVNEIRRGLGLSAVRWRDNGM